MSDKTNIPGFDIEQKNILMNFLEPIETMTMADQVEKSLLNYIIRESFKPGDAIPSEIELAETLGVSRTVLREGLSRLRMLGLVVTKKKKGMVIAEPDLMSGFERMLHPGILGGQKRKEIFELRLVLEVGLGDLLFARIKPKDIKQLEAIIEREEKAATYAERIRCDIDFHGTLYRIAGNETLKRFQGMLLPVFEFVVEKHAKLEHTSTGTVKHADILHILKHGKVDDFPNAMRQHLQKHFELL